MKVFLPIGYKVYIYSKVYIARKKYMSDVFILLRKILRPRAELNHVLGRFWGRDFKFQFRSDT